MAVQLELGGDVRSKGRDLPGTFRRLYYHLYSNSKASRAERIIGDLALLLLLKLAADRGPGKAAVRAFLNDGGSSEHLLVPVLIAEYPELLGKNEKFHIGDRSLKWALEELDGLDLTHAPAHVLGEAFQALMGPRLRGEKGQFFTPRSLVRAMVQIVAPEPWESVLDPACGTGGFLVEAHAFQAGREQRGRRRGPLVGVDKDQDLTRLAAALTRVACGSRVEVHNFSSLTQLEWEEATGRRVDGLYDVVLTNPPFGARISIKEPEVLSEFDLGRQWIEELDSNTWRKSNALVASQDPQTLFLELCVRSLKPGGRMGIVLPEGVFGNKGSRYIWEWLTKQGTITALLDCPRTTFQPGTDTKTNVLFFQKSGKQRERKGATISVAVAIQCGHDRRGRAQGSDGSPYPDDFPRLAASFHQRNGSDSCWQRVQLKSYDYLVPRYFSEVPAQNEQERDLTLGARVITLGDLCEQGILEIRKGHEVGSDAYGTGEVPFIRTSDLSNYEVSTDPTKAVSDDVYAQFAGQQKLRPGDVLIAVDGRYRIGTTAILTERNTKSVVQSHIRIITAVDRDALDPFALLFALNLPSVKLRIRNLVFIQSTLGTLGKRLYELRLPLLMGEGPWAERVANFRNVLTERDRLLQKITSFVGPEVEL